MFSRLSHNRLGAQRLWSAPSSLPRRVAPLSACRAVFSGTQTRVERGRCSFLGDVSALLPQPQALYSRSPSRRQAFKIQSLFEKFTEPALRSVVAAQKETQRLQSPEVRTVLQLS